MCMYVACGNKNSPNYEPYVACRISNIPPAMSLYVACRISYIPLAMSLYVACRISYIPVAMSLYVACRISLHSSSHVVGSERSAANLGRFTPAESPPYTLVVVWCNVFLYLQFSNPILK
jgi:hypothetical protein